MNRLLSMTTTSIPLAMLVLAGCFGRSTAPSAPDDAGAPIGTDASALGDGSTPPACNGGSGTWLAFDSNRGGARGIYLVKSDGTGLHRLTTSSANESEPAFSPDGKKLAYTSDASGFPQVFVLELATHTSTQLSHRPYGAHEAAWSRDGARLAYVGIPEGEQDAGASNPPAGIADIFVIGADGTGERDVVGGDAGGWYPAYYPRRPAFGPDSNAIVYAQSETIRTIRIDGTGERQIAGIMTEGSETPSVSPDGADVAFASSDIVGEAVRVTSFAGNSEDPAHDGKARRLTSTTSRNPAWSAEGDIAYETALSFATSATIAVVPATGGTPHDVTSAGFDDRNPSWAPAGFAAP